MTRKEVEKLIKIHQNTKSQLKVKRAERKMCSLRKKGEEEIKINITSTYEENIRSNNISDPTSNNTINRIDKIRELEAELNKLELEIAELEIKEAKENDILKCLTYKEKVVLEGKILNPDLDLDEIGRTIYYKTFNETRSEDVIARILKKAYKKLENEKCG